MAGTNGNLLMAGYNAAANNNTITVSGTNSLLDIQSGEIHLGEFASGNQLIIQNGGIVSNVTGYLGYNNSGSGNLSANNAATITGSGALWNNSANLYLGYATGSTNNQLTISNGGQVNNVTGYVGYGTNTANSVVTITGSGALWNNSGDLYLGFGVGASNTQFTISNGAHVNNGNATIGAGGGNTILVTGSNSLWNSSAGFTVNGNGNQLTVSDGAAVSVGGTNYIGYGSGDNNNTVLVTGSGTVWTNGGALYISYNGQNNSLVISNGATVASASGWTSGNGSNSVLVAGNNSTWNIGSTLNLGGYDQFTISGTGAVVRAGGTMLMSGGNQLTITNGGQLIIGGNFRAQNAQDVILVTGPGSVWTNSGAFDLGKYFGDNQMIIANGGVIVSADALIGKGSSGSVVTSNSVLVTGAGSRWNISGNLTEAGGSYQTVTVSNGGVVQVSGNVLVGTVSGDINNQIVVAGGGLTATNAGTGILTIGSGGALNLNAGAVLVNQLTATGAVNIAGGTLTTYGAQLIVTNGSTLAIGNTAGQTATWNILGGTNSIVSAGGHNTALGTVAGAQARLLVTGAGVILTNSSNLRIGNVAGADNNQLTVADGAQLIKQNALFIGDASSGNQMTLTTGGVVNNGWYGYLGYNASATGNTVLITGAGSAWRNSSDLQVGGSGGGNQMTIADGGALRVNGYTFVGYNASASNNTILVTGNGSVWTNTSALYLGCQSTGNTLIISNNGVVVVGGTVNVGYNNTVNNRLILAGGQLNASTITVSSNNTFQGTGTITGNVQIQSGGTLSPGNSIGTLVFSNNLTLAGTLNIELDNAAGAAGTGDFVNVVGQLDLTGATLNFTALSTLTNSVYVFGQYGSLMGAFSAMNNLPSGYTLNTAYNGNELAVEAIPEPSSLLLVGGGLLGLGLLLRRKRFQAR